MFNKISPFFIAFLYFLITLCWIVFSEIILLNSGFDDAMKNKLEVVKGIFFIFISTIILYFLLKKWENQIKRKNEILEKIYKQLEISPERLKLAFDASKEGYWEHDLRTNELVHSPSMYTMFGIEDLNMQNDFSWWNEHVLTDDLPNVMGTLEKCAKGEIDSYDFIFRIKPLDEKLFFIRTRGKVIKNSEGKVVKMYGTHLDVTKLKEYESELLKLNETLQERVEKESQKLLEKEKILIQQSKMAMMGEMIGAIAHQWRQPLNALGITIQDIEVAYKFGELNDEYLANYKKQSMCIIQTMSNTIDDFKNFFSPNKKQEEFYIEDAISEVLKILEAQLRLNGIEVIMDGDDESKHSHTCFKNELKQVILNLLANAKDALLEKKRERSFIKIDILKTDKGCQVSIEDSAGGVSEDIVGKIFEPHFTTKSADKGTGIGLYLSKDIVENHLNGKLEVENTQNGAKFTIFLPVYPHRL